MLCAGWQVLETPWVSRRVSIVGHDTVLNAFKSELPVLSYSSRTIHNGSWASVKM